MTLPDMSIFIGGDEEYAKRVEDALFERGLAWLSDDRQEYRYLHKEVIRVEDGTMRDGYHYGGNGNSPYFRLTDDGKLVPKEADDEGWIQWSGGECPVHSALTVEIYMSRNHGDCKTNRDDAGTFRWNRTWFHDDITYYRVPSMIFQTSQVRAKQETDTKHEDIGAAQALRVVAQGYEEGDENPWGRIEFYNYTYDQWFPAHDQQMALSFLEKGMPVREKPKTKKIEGQISEDSINHLRNEFMRPFYNATMEQEIAKEILSMVKD